MEPETRGLFEEYGTGYGASEPILVADPAPGANASLKVTRAGYYRPLAVVCRFVASGNAANRWIELDYQTDAGFVWCRNGGAPILVASDAFNVCWKIAQGMSDFASSATGNSPLCYPLAPLFVPQGHVLAITVGNIDATDQLSAIAFLVEEFDVGPRGYPVGRQPGG